MAGARFVLSYEGELADRNLINAYDAAAALRGFERSLALTAHAVLNGEIIVQAPSLKGAEILFAPPEAGSWQTNALVLIGGLWALNNVSTSSPIGHLLYSAYDYVVHSATGATVDYDKPMRVILDEARDAAPEASENLNINVLDGVIERAEKSIEEMHRPIVETETAGRGFIRYPNSLLPDIEINRDTYDYISQSIERKDSEEFEGAVSSYNINSFTGRVYVPSLGRTIPFLLSDSIRDRKHIDRVTDSLRSNALRLGNELFTFDAIVMESVSGRVKRLIIFDF